MVLKVVFAVLALIAVAVIALLLYASTRPSEFRVTRSQKMSAPPGAIFAQLNDLKKWAAWSPWDQMDPAMKKTYEGAESGEGATYAWAGNKNVGEGKMTIIESKPNESLTIKLEFYKPMAGVSTAQFDLTPDGDGTNVTWSMDGTNNFVAKVVCLFMDMDKMIGGNFEQGLTQLKAIVEKPAA